MKRIVEIYLKGIGKLDIQSKILDKFGLEVTYNMSDIEDVGSRKSNYSKTFKIIGTPNNNKIFSNVYDINFESDTYDINKRQPCYVTVNKNMIIDGYLKLRGVDKTFIAGKYQVVYTVNVYDDIKDIFSEFGEKNLRDLDFTENWSYMGNNYDSGNHVYSTDNVIASQFRINEPKNVYEYCITNWNYNGSHEGNYWPKEKGFNLSMFYPSLYIKAVVDKMFSDIGYVYESDFLNGVSFDGIFPTLGTIYNGSDMLLTKDSYYRQHNYTGQEFINTYDSDEKPTDENTPTIKITNTPVYQVDNLDYNDGCKILTGGGGTYNFDITIRFTENDILENEIGIYLNSFLVFTDGVDDLYEYNLGDGVYSGEDISIEVDIELQENTVVYPYIRVGVISDLGLTPQYIGQEIILEFWSMRINVVFADVETSYRDLEISVSQFLPNMTQADFFKSLIKQFNLYIQADKLEEKKVIIEPRREFFQKGSVLDWTQKVNDDVMSFKPTNKKIKRYYDFKMGEIDSLKTNKYVETWDSNYGNKEVDVESEDFTGTNNIESEFGGYDYTFKSFINSDYTMIPNLTANLTDTYNTQKREIAPSIGFISNHTTANVDWRFAGDDVAVPSWNTINHVERFSNGISRFDLNFETKQGTDSYVNSYDNFWKAGMENLFNINNRLVTYFVNLNIDDIQNLDLKNVVLIKNELYYIESVTVDINSDKPSKVQLIKAYDYLRYQKPEELPLLWGKYDTGMEIGSGAGRPLINESLLDTGYILNIKTDTSFTLEVNTNTENYLWFATPNQSIYNKKNSWAVSEFNKGAIGGDINIGGNLFPEPEQFEYNGDYYNVYLANYQTIIDRIKLDYAESTNISAPVGDYPTEEDEGALG